ncbi:leucine-, glutamate- and lysine-rich protein 1 isoform X1 [Protobothrops mucrosquamatus]|uniref:leucine-, glutamate- and lysine-rich protein 1 isoform X1 n=1 Tax=Protobothrops mucrosquamatus TaxID=103944 RepID=UPI000775768B|nr:leucine-, glutamate- and lysine-rich protein 1 isoform X1 [Protobothrops mucrosquamatus]
MDRHIPVYPLPEEIRKMSRDETICKYCGVSYLVLHEFKLLDEKVKAMEKKMKFYEGSVEREKILQEKLQCLSQDFEQCTAASESKTERIKELVTELENKETAIENLNKQSRSFHKEKEDIWRQSQLVQKTLQQHKFILKKAFILIPFIREELNKFKEEVLGFLKEWISLKGEIFLQLKTINKIGLAEVSSLNQTLGECQRKNLVLQEEVEHLKVKSDAAALEAKQLQASLLRENELQNKCKELQKKTQEITDEIQATELKFQKAAGEITYFKELVVKKSKECEDHQREFQKLSSEIGIAKSRFTHIVTEKEQSLLACQQMYQCLQEETIAKEKREDNFKKRTKILESELETINKLLKQQEEEIVILKQERESVLVSHKKITEQLQETLRQKVLNEKNWQEKVETDRVKEHTSHKEEIARLKEDARIELDIEKQKHQELIAKYQKDQYELLHTKIPLLICDATNKLKVEMETLEKKLHEAERRVNEKDHKREKEWQSLKRQITELEFQLKEEQGIHNSVTEEMKEEIKKKTRELEKLTEEQKQLIQTMNQVQEENALLQDTVRRECEERYELTEALVQAKEQVMELKKLGGNFPLTQCSLGQGSSTSSSTLINSQRCPKASKRITSEISRTTKAVVCGRNQNSFSVSLPALPTLQSPQRRTSLDESRRRITAVIKRQMSQL